MDLMAKHQPSRPSGESCGDQVAPLSEAQNLIRIGLKDDVPSWEVTMKHIFRVSIPSLHVNTNFLLLHNALPVISNVAKWNRWQNRQSAKCTSCNSVETLLHPFFCSAFSSPTECIYSIVEDVLPKGMSLEGFVTLHIGNLTARSLSTELVHQVWRARCMRVFERKEVDWKVVVVRVIESFLKAANLTGNLDHFVTSHFIIFNGELVYMNPTPI